MSAPMLEVSDLQVTFHTSQGAIAALRAVSLRIEKGQTLALVGESGSGKSSLALAVLGLIERDAGTVRIDGQPLGPATRPRAQLVFQEAAAALDPRFTIGRCIAEPLAIHRLHPGPARAARVLELLAMVELPADVVERFPHQLSAGQLQRVCLARALAVEPELLVLDEPLASLDVSVQAQMLALLQRLARQRSLTYLLISHDLPLVSHLASQVAVLYAGRIVEQGPAELVLTHPAHPYTQALLAASAPVETRRTAPPLRGEPPSPLAVPPGCAFHPRCPYALAACSSALPPWREHIAGHRVSCVLSEPP